MTLTTKIGMLLSTITLASMAYVGAEARYAHKEIILDEQLICLAHNIYFESRGESKLGQRAVAWVTLNRVQDKNWPDNICDVVWQSKQFSWTHDGKSDKPQDKQAWEYARFVAHHVYTNYQLIEDPTDGAVYFHANYVEPGWRTRVTKTVQIDKHIFYKH